MKIDTTLIDGYADMSAEEKVAALEAFEYADGSEEIAKYKDILSKANSEAAEHKRKYRELLTEEERKKQEDDERWAQMEEELNALKCEKMLAEYKAQYVSLGYPEELAVSTAKAMIDGDTATLFANNKLFMEAHDKDVEAALIKGTPRPPVGNGANSPSVTREDFLKMSYEEVVALKESDPITYEKLTK